MYCPKCGCPTPDDSLFCQSCGSSLSINEEHQAIESSLQISDPDYTIPCWYIFSGNERSGPYSKKQMYEMANNGLVSRGTMVWKAGMIEWVKIELSELNGVLIRTMPPIPMTAISDKWLWALATVPFIDLLIRTFLNYQVAPNPVVPLIIALVLNSTFLILDMKSLEKSGVNIEKWLWCGILLIPVYLFVRASKTTKNVIPGIVWIILEVLLLLS